MAPAKNPNKPAKKAPEAPGVEEPSVEPQPTPEVPAEQQPAQAEPEQEADPGVDVYGSPYGRRVQQKAVLYTDGISGTADSNHERAYEYSERLQSNNAAVRAAGDESLSEAAKSLRSDKDSQEAENVKSGERES